MAGRGADRLKEYRVHITSVRHWLAEIDFEGLLIVEIYNSWFGYCQVFLPTINKVMLTIDDAEEKIKWLVINVAKLEEEQKELMLEEEKKKQEMASVLRRKVQLEEGLDSKGDDQDGENSFIDEDSGLGKHSWDKVTIPKLEKYSGYDQPQPLWLLMKESQILHEVTSANPPKMLRLIQSVLSGIPIPEKELWDMDFHPELDKKKQEEKRAKAEAKRQAKADKERAEKERKEKEERAAAASPHMKPQIYVSMAIRDLPNGENAEDAGPLSAIISVKVKRKDGQFVYYGQSERIDNDQNPMFMKLIKFDDPAPVDDVKLLVFQTTHDNVADQPDSAALGETVISIGEFLGAKDSHKRFKEIKLVNSLGEDVPLTALVLKVWRKTMPGDLTPLSFTVSTKVDPGLSVIAGLEVYDNNMQKYYPCGYTEVNKSSLAVPMLNFITNLVAADFTKLERTLRFTLYNAVTFFDPETSDKGFICQAVVDMGDVQTKRAADKDARMVYNWYDEKELPIKDDMALTITAQELVAQDPISKQVHELSMSLQGLERGDLAETASRPVIRMWKCENPFLNPLDAKEEKESSDNLEDEEKKWIWIGQTEEARMPDAADVTFYSNFFVDTRWIVKIGVYDVTPLLEGEDISEDLKESIDSHTDGKLLGEIVLPSTSFDPDPFSDKNFLLRNDKGRETKTTLRVRARACGLATPVSLAVNCRDLPEIESAQCYLQIKGYESDEYVTFGETEMIENNAHPEFQTVLHTERFHNFDRVLRICIRDGADGTFVGDVKVSLNKFFGDSEVGDNPEYEILGADGAQVDGKSLMWLTRTSPIPPYLESKDANRDPADLIGHLAVHVKSQTEFGDEAEKGVIAVLCQKSRQGNYIWKGQTERVLPDEKNNYVFGKPFLLDKSDRLKSYRVCLCQSGNDNKVDGIAIGNAYGQIDFELHNLSLMANVGEVSVQGISNPKSVDNTFVLRKDGKTLEAGTCTLNAYECGTTTLCSLNVAASALPNPDGYTRPDVLCAACVQHMGTKEWIPIARTEYLANDNHPDWEEDILIHSYSIVEQQIRLQVYDSNSETDSLKPENVMGYATFNLNQFLSQTSPEIDLKLLDVKTRKELGSGKTTLHVRCKKEPGCPAVTSTRATVADLSRSVTNTEVMVRCCNLVKDLNNESSPLIAFYEPDGLTLIGQTERISGDLNPAFNKIFFLDIANDKNIVLCRVWDSVSDDISEATELLGECSIDLLEVFSMPGNCKEIPLVDDSMQQVKRATILVSVREPTDRGEVTLCHLTASCAGLPNHPVTGSCNPVVDLQAWNASIGTWEHVYQSECFEANHDPEFKRDLCFEHFSKMDRKLRFAVYDVSDPSSAFDESALLGEATISSNQVRSRGASGLELPLTRGGDPIKANISLKLKVEGNIKVPVNAEVVLGSAKRLDPMLLQFFVKSPVNDAWEAVGHTDVQTSDAAGVIKFKENIFMPYDIEEPTSNVRFALFAVSDPGEADDEKNLVGEVLIDAAIIATSPVTRLFELVKDGKRISNTAALKLHPNNAQLGIRKEASGFNWTCPSRVGDAPHILDKKVLTCIECGENLDPSLCAHRFGDLKCSRCQFPEPNRSYKPCPAGVGEGHHAFVLDEKTGKRVCSQCGKDEESLIDDKPLIPQDTPVVIHDSNADDETRNDADATPGPTADNEAKGEDTPAEPTIESVTFLASCRNLKKMDVNSESDPLLVIYDAEDKIVAQTEKLMNTSNPEFKTELTVAANDSDTKEFVVKVYERDAKDEENKFDDRNLLGMAKVGFSALPKAGTDATEWMTNLTLADGSEAKSAEGEVSTVTFTAKATQAAEDTTEAKKPEGEGKDDGAAVDGEGEEGEGKGEAKEPEGEGEGASTDGDAADAADTADAADAAGAGIDVKDEGGDGESKADNGDAKDDVEKPAEDGAASGTIEGESEAQAGESEAQDSSSTASSNDAVQPASGQMEEEI